MGTTTIHGEIEYVREDGTKVHSDICPAECNSENMNDPEWRSFIHECLNEWLDKGNGTGCFYIEEDGWKRT